MKKKKILILIGGHLATAPRVQKEAAALKKAGAEVLIRGNWLSTVHAQEDLEIAKALEVDFSAVVSFCDDKQLLVRVFQKISQIVFSTFGLVTPRLYGIGGPELLKSARQINADLTLVHSEAGLWVANQMLAEGYKVGVDFEDWFSQDLPLSDRKLRPVKQLRALEHHLLKYAHCCFATTQAMADALAKDAGTLRLPLVIPNCFPVEDRLKATEGKQDEKAKGVISFYWFSQTIGPGRGLEILAEALSLLTGDWQLVLRGDLRGYRAWFDELFSGEIRSHVYLAGPVPNCELLARTMSHDVGLALEIPFCPSRDVTATNKIFEYLRAGLAVIATNTKGQKEIMSKCSNSGVVIAENTASELASAMQLYVSQSSVLESSKRSALDSAASVWPWSKYEQILIKKVSSVLSST